LRRKFAVLKVQAAQEGAVHLRKELSAQQGKLPLLEAEKTKVTKLSVENEALQQQLSCSQLKKRRKRQAIRLRTFGKQIANNFKLMMTNCLKGN